MSQYGDSYAGAIREIGCAICGVQVLVHAAHVTSRGAGGLACDLVPLCGYHHAEEHRAGHETFQAKYGVDLEALAARLWERLSPEHLPCREAVIAVLALRVAKGMRLSRAHRKVWKGENERTGG